MRSDGLRVGFGGDLSIREGEREGCRIREVRVTKGEVYTVEDGLNALASFITPTSTFGSPKELQIKALQHPL